METMEMQPGSMLALFETDKEQRSSFVMQIIEDLQEGRRDPLNVHLQVKCMEETIKMLTDKRAYPTTAEPYGEMLLEAAQQQGKEFTHHNAKFSIKEVGTSYDFTNCNDEVYLNLAAQMDALKASIKERETFLKSIGVHGLDIITPDGEGVKIFAPAKKSTTSVAVSLK